MRKIMSLALAVLVLTGCSQKENQKQNTISMAEATDREELLLSLDPNDVMMYDVNLEKEFQSIVVKIYEWKDDAWNVLHEVKTEVKDNKGTLALGVTKDGESFYAGFMGSNQKPTVVSAVSDQTDKPAAMGRTMTFLSKDKELSVDQEISLASVQFNDGGIVSAAEDLFENPQTYIKDNIKKATCVTVTFESKE